MPPSSAHQHTEAPLPDSSCAASVERYQSWPQLLGLSASGALEGRSGKEGQVLSDAQAEVAVEVIPRLLLFS